VSTHKSALSSLTAETEADPEKSSCPELFPHGVHLCSVGEYQALRARIVHGVTCTALAYLEDNAGLPRNMLEERGFSMCLALTLWWDANNRVATDEEYALYASQSRRALDS
jgi:hypothetical protein